MTFFYSNVKTINIKGQEGRYNFLIIGVLTLNVRNYEILKETGPGRRFLRSRFKFVLFGQISSNPRWVLLVIGQRKYPFTNYYHA